MAQSKPSSSFLDLNNAKANIEEVKKRVEKKDAPGSADTLSTDPAHVLADAVKSKKKKTEAQRKASGEAQKRQVTIDNKVFKAIKQEQAERLDEKPTLSDIIDEALRARYDL